jgi:hypothetical protein
MVSSEYGNLKNWYGFEWWSAGLMNRKLNGSSLVFGLQNPLILPQSKLMARVYRCGDIV